jgi:hypothetical protein
MLVGQPTTEKPTRLGCNSDNYRQSDHHYLSQFLSASREVDRQK